jgi:hypothetical protein
MTPQQLGRAVMEATMNEAPLTISVPEAGKKYFGLSRNASYDAASRGELPVVKIGRLLRVPVRLLERMLDEASKAA